MNPEVLVYDVSWEDVPEQDWPPIGGIYVCRDCQNRLHPESWSVSIMGNGTFEGDTVHLGLFWHREDAVLFAEARNSPKAESAKTDTQQLKDSISLFREASHYATVAHRVNDNATSKIICEKLNAGLAKLESI